MTSAPVSAGRSRFPVVEKLLQEILVDKFPRAVNLLQTLQLTSLVVIVSWRLCCEIGRTCSGGVDSSLTESGVILAPFLDRKSATPFASQKLCWCTGFPNFFSSHLHDPTTELKIGGALSRIENKLVELISI